MSGAWISSSQKPDVGCTGWEFGEEGNKTGLFERYWYRRWNENICSLQEENDRT